MQPSLPEIEVHLVNTVLTNGARYYVDHAIPNTRRRNVRRSLNFSPRIGLESSFSNVRWRPARRFLGVGEDIIV